MRSRFASLALAAVPLLPLLAPWCQAVLAQSNPAALAVGNPYLLLIRDPVVHEELNVTDRQEQSITRVTDQLDGRLLAIRGQSVQQGTGTLQKLITDTQAKMNAILTPAQQKRFSEIVLRVQGIRAILQDENAAKLSLSDEQKTRLQELFAEIDETLQTARKKAEASQSQQSLQEEFVRLREDEQRRVLEILNNTQRGHLVEMAGKQFDTSRLGKVAFKSPEIKSNGPWINSSPLSLPTLKGKVVAVHFWTFG